MIAALLVVISLAALISSALADCDEFKSCVSCTKAKLEDAKSNQCEWSRKRGCEKLLGADALLSKDTVRYEDTCPVDDTESSDDKDFLSNWIGKLLKAGTFKDLTLLDLSLPGTHDTLTYDLALKTSDGGVDGHDEFAELMHEHSKLVPDAVEDFIRQQAMTNALTVTQQLDNGVRFLDLRMMFEYTSFESDSKKDNNDNNGNNGKSKDEDEVDYWYSLHFMQSNKRMLDYFTEIRIWLDTHPSEVVVMWLSKHGSTCATGQDQYPNVSIDIKRAFWTEITNCFKGLLINTQSQQGAGAPTLLNETSISSLIEKNERAIMYVSDYNELTNSSPFALDGCLIENRLGPSVDDEPAALIWEQRLYMNATLEKFHTKQKQGLLLMSLATGVPAAQVVASGDLRFRHNGQYSITTDSTLAQKSAVKKCSEVFNIPGFDSWCPSSLLDVAYLENYYKQITLDEAYEKRQMGWAFPNAIYINGFASGGTIRTGK